MTMNNFGSLQSKPDLDSETAVIEVKATLSAVRGMRDALISLAIRVLEDNRHGYLLLLDPGLSNSFLEKELRKIKFALRPDLAKRLFLVVAKQGKIMEGVGSIPSEDRELLNRAIAAEKKHGTKLASPNKQDEVFLVMLHQWVTGQGPMTSRWLEETVDCNYRTVASAIERLGHAVRRQSDRSVALKYFPEQEWGRLLAVAQRTRSTMLYADASGQPRSPESLLRRLPGLNRPDVAVGGVLGAKRYFDDLDIVGTPRLDLCIHCPGKRIDLEFVQKLDPGLVRTRDTHQPAQLALHFLRRKEPLFDKKSQEFPWADSVECLLELYSARLDPQARSFQEFLSTRGRELSSDD
ncbi:MAG: hypothetical protein RBT03_09390 [Kiritimatiellia bacterium]|nr:hypothetical protein [Kiritimatiellia bacterium]